jgi:hypothetical protein
MPLLGFGAKLKEFGITHCFALNGNIFRPEAVGIQSAINCYIDSLKKVTLSGPTYFAPIIKTISDIANVNNYSYMVFLLLTDGVIMDFEETVNEIVRASALPISIVIVGVGHENFDAMKKLDSDKAVLQNSKGEQAKRDIVQFVSFRDYKSDPMKLAKETLKEIPKQFIQYVELANIPVTFTKDNVDYFGMKRKQFIDYMVLQGFNGTKVGEVLDIGIPFDNIEQVAKILKDPSHYINPLK